MTRIFTSLCLLFFVSMAQAAEPCTGSTEELLECHSGEVKAFLGRWVKAWGNGDIETYISLYANARSPNEDLSRVQWEKNRRDRISPDKQIELNLKLESMGLEDSGIFDIVFQQQYSSASYRDEVRKRLFLVREDGDLKIWKEEVLD
jgi:murein L,D-transpeptidase YafK